MRKLASMQAISRLVSDWQWGDKASVAQDGFSGDVVGWYVTREGKPGLVIEQDGTTVVHVYREGRAHREGDDRRCQTGLVGAAGECLACDAESGEACRDKEER